MAFQSNLCDPTMLSQADARPQRPSARFFLAAMAILLLGIALRQLFLGPAPFHPDEAIHAHFSYGFNSYQYNPTFHGPLLYHLVSGVFGLFGQNDYTARLVPSLLGILLLWMILFPARRFLGNRAAIVSAAFVAVSPSVVTYSRHLLHDALVLVLTLGAVLCLATALQTASSEPRGRAARIGCIAFLSLFLATKANCFFVAVMLVSFWCGWRFCGTLKIEARARDWGSRALPPICFALVSLSAVFWPRDNTFLPQAQATQHGIFQVLSLAACAWMFFWLLLRRPEESETQRKTAWKSGDPTTYVLALAAGLWIYLVLFGGVAQTLIAWTQTGVFPSLKFAEGMESARTAIGKMLEYWGGQQAQPRLPGRHDYYIVLGLLYELPLYLAALGGIWHAARNRSAFTDLLLWWSFTSYTVYAVANEKVPWLIVHIVLPLALLSGVWLGQIRLKKPIFWPAAILGAFFCLRGDWAFIFERAGDNAEPMLYAQTPDAFRDAVQEGLKNTREVAGGLWMENERQWPSVWYFREKDNPLRGNSGQLIGGRFDPRSTRLAVGQEKDQAAMEASGFVISKVNFLIWPRASWAAIEPHRYWRWFWTRDTMPLSERGTPQSTWKNSILAGKGEWSNALAVVGSHNPLTRR